MDARTRALFREKMFTYVTTAFSASGAHGLDHVMRVTSLAERIGRTEGADLDILIPAALFHDIARPVEKKDGTPHEEKGAEMAELFLTGIHYDESLIPPIVHAIRTHRFRSDKKPGTLEAKILSDADKLDAMGATGIARTFMRAGEHNGVIQDAIDHIHEKLLKLNDHLYTQTAMEMAQHRHNFVSFFVKSLEEELSVCDSSPLV